MKTALAGARVQGAILAWLVGVAPAMAASDCDNFFGQRCLANLATGVHMSYFELGSETGEPLILLHTDTTSAVDWAWTGAALVSMDHELHIYALDQRGAGATELPNIERCRSHPNSCITEADLAADVLAFMDAKGIARATLVGHALGAGAARNVALQHPDRVVRLILSGTGPPRAAAIAASAAQPTPPPGIRTDPLAPLGWQKMLEDKGVQWPQRALHMRPIDIDPDAVRNIARHWDISAIAAPGVVDAIAAQTAGESLATWGVIDPTPAPPTAPERLEALSVPTLVLWGSEDAGLNRESQERLIAVLKEASRTNKRMYFYWKQYGVRPPPRSHDKHDADDIGHNLSWEAPRQLASDIDSFVRTGAPTRDLYRTDAPADIHRILVEPGKAIIVSSRP
jgi:pimeloyl-ACP methyl ester carboxylesterase